jgi:dTDP-4-amino-4,6-dideoxygalactose transaminase
MSDSGPKDNEFLVFGAPAIEQPEIDEVVDSLHSGWLGTGPKVARFEEAIASFKGVEHALALNSCTAALHLSLMCLDLQPGDEVITTPLTFCATVNAIIHAGGTPVLADIDRQTMNIDPVEVERQVSEHTRAILPVHFAGRPCDMDRLCAIAKRHDLALVEDCAHAIEATYRGRHVGTFGDFGCFSFYVTKNVVTGEGGAVITPCEEYAERMQVLSLHGMSKDAWKRFGGAGYQHYEVIEAGFKYNMMDLQAALGLHQLARVAQNWQRRRDIWHIYKERLEGLPLGLPAPDEADTRHASHLFTVLVDEEVAGMTRDEFVAGLQTRNIGTGVHYRSLPEHAVYQERFGWKPEDVPNAHLVGQQTVSIPLSAALDADDVEMVTEAIFTTLEQSGGR